MKVYDFAKLIKELQDLKNSPKLTSSKYISDVTLRSISERCEIKKEIDKK